MRRHTNKQFVQKRAEQKDHEARSTVAEASPYEGTVDVPLHKVVDGLVPSAPVGSDRAGVPPAGERGREVSCYGSRSLSGGGRKARTRCRILGRQSGGVLLGR